MKKIYFTLNKAQYPIYIGKDLLMNLNNILDGIINNERIFILTDENVAYHYLDIIIESLSNINDKINYYILPPGEHSKTIEAYQEIINLLIENNFSRNSTLIALGGGVIGDLGAYIASTYMRGINLIQAPTSLMAHIDSSIGGKTGINHNNIKNIIGTFYHPKYIIIDQSTLKTLPKREYRSAYSEIIKYGMLDKYSMLESLNKNATQFLDYYVNIEPLITDCIQIKNKFVYKDEQDHGIRNFLNLGHTFGHAIESSTNFNKYLHGEAIAIGILIASRLSYNLNYIDYDYFQMIFNLLNQYHLIKEKIDLQVQYILEYMYKDKKNKGNMINIVLPIEKEKVQIFQDIPLVEVKKAILEVNYGYFNQ